MRNQRTTRRRTFSVSAARSAWVIGRAALGLSPSRVEPETDSGWRSDGVVRDGGEVLHACGPKRERKGNAFLAVLTGSGTDGDGGASSQGFCPGPRPA